MKNYAKVQDSVMADARKINFKGELGAFLPADQHAIIRDFPDMFERELNRQLAAG